MSNLDALMNSFGRHTPKILRRQLIFQLAEQYIGEKAKQNKDDPSSTTEDAGIVVNNECKPSIQRFHGALLFVDISGFTALSLRLSVEELKNHINDYFTAMLDIVDKNGGDVIKFAGDALFIIWETAAQIVPTESPTSTQSPLQQQQQQQQQTPQPPNNSKRTAVEGEEHRKSPVGSEEKSSVRSGRNGKSVERSSLRGLGRQLFGGGQGPKVNTTVTAPVVDSKFQAQCKIAVDRAIECGLEISKVCGNHKVILTQKSNPAGDTAKTPTAKSTSKAPSMFRMLLPSIQGTMAGILGTSSSTGALPTAPQVQSAIMNEPMVSFEEEETVAYLNVHSGVSVGLMAGIDIGANDRWEYFLVGEPLTKVAVAEGQAKTGDVVVCPESHALFCPAIESVVEPTTTVGPVVMSSPPHQTLVQNVQNKARRLSTMSLRLISSTGAQIGQSGHFSPSSPGLKRVLSMNSTEEPPLTCSCTRLEDGYCKVVTKQTPANVSSNRKSRVKAKVDEAMQIDDALSKESKILDGINTDINDAFIAYRSFVKKEILKRVTAHEMVKKVATAATVTSNAAANASSGTGTASNSSGPNSSGSGLLENSVPVEEHILNITKTISLSEHPLNETNNSITMPIGGLLSGQITPTVMHQKPLSPMPSSSAITQNGVASPSPMAPGPIRRMLSSSKLGVAPDLPPSGSLSRTPSRSRLDIVGMFGRSNSKARLDIGTNNNGCNNANSKPPPDVFPIGEEHMRAHFIKWVHDCLRDDLARHVHDVARNDYIFKDVNRTDVMRREFDTQIKIMQSRHSHGGGSHHRLTRAELANSQSKSTSNHRDLKYDGGVDGVSSHSTYSTSTHRNSSSSSRSLHNSKSSSHISGGGSNMLSPLRKKSSSRRLLDAQDTAALIAEIRQVTVMFVKIDMPNMELLIDSTRGAVAGSPKHMTAGRFIAKAVNEKLADQLLLDRLQSCIEALTQAFANNGGQMRQFIVDDKGTVCIGTFGLRGSMNDDNAAAALETAKVIVDRLQGIGLNSSIGVTVGRAYCGLVGSSKRHEYAVMGPSTNLSARLMCKAPPGGILCDTEIRNRDRTHAFQSLGDIVAKGYKDPVGTFMPLFDGQSDPKGAMTTGITSEGRMMLRASFDYYCSDGNSTVANALKKVHAENHLLRREGSGTMSITSSKHPLASGSTKLVKLMLKSNFYLKPESSPHTANLSSPRSGTTMLKTSLAAAAGQKKARLHGRREDIERITTFMFNTLVDSSVSLQGISNSKSREGVPRSPSQQVSPRSGTIPDGHFVGVINPNINLASMSCMSFDDAAAGAAGNHTPVPVSIRPAFLIDQPARFVGITAAQGMGKTALVTSLTQQIFQVAKTDPNINIHLFKSRYNSFQVSVPFNAWKPVICEMLIRVCRQIEVKKTSLGLTPKQRRRSLTAARNTSSTADLQTGADFLISRLTESLQRYKPLLGDLSILPADTDAIEALNLTNAEKLEKSSELLLAIIQMYTNITGNLVFITVEDIHSFDLASLSLLHQIWVHNKGIVVVFTGRPQQQVAASGSPGKNSSPTNAATAERKASLRQQRNSIDYRGDSPHQTHEFTDSFNDLDRYFDVELSKLDKNATAMLAKDALATFGVTIHDSGLIDQLCAVSGGNPMYAYELSKSLAEQDVHHGVVDTSVLNKVIATFKSTRIEEVICHRFDQLNTAAQTVLKMAAVASSNGAHFTFAMLAFVLDEESSGGHGSASHAESHDGQQSAFASGQNTANNSVRLNGGGQQYNSIRTTTTSQSFIIKSPTGSAKTNPRSKDFSIVNALYDIVQSDDFICVVSTREDSSNNNNSNSSGKDTFPCPAGGGDDATNSTDSAHSSDKAQSSSTINNNNNNNNSSRNQEGTSAENSQQNVLTLAIPTDSSNMAGSVQRGIKKHHVTKELIAANHYVFEFNITLELRTIYDLLLDDQKQVIHECVAEYYQSQREGNKLNAVASDPSQAADHLWEESYHWQQASEWNNAMQSAYFAAMLETNDAKQTEYLNMAYVLYNTVRTHSDVAGNVGANLHSTLSGDDQSAESTLIIEGGELYFSDIKTLFAQAYNFKPLTANSNTTSPERVGIADTNNKSNSNSNNNGGNTNSNSSANLVKTSANVLSMERIYQIFSGDSDLLEIGLQIHIKIAQKYISQLEDPAVTRQVVEDCMQMMLHCKNPFLLSSKHLSKMMNSMAQLRSIMSGDNFDDQLISKKLDDQYFCVRDFNQICFPVLSAYVQNYLLTSVDSGEYRKKAQFVIEKFLELAKDDYAEAVLVAGQVNYIQALLLNTHMLYKLGKISDALICFEEVLPVYKASQHSAELISVYGHDRMPATLGLLSQTLFQIGQWAKATEYLNQAIRLLNNLTHTVSIAAAITRVVSTLAFLQRFSEALALFTAYLNNKDTHDIEFDQVVEDVDKVVLEWLTRRVRYDSFCRDIVNGTLEIVQKAAQVFLEDSPDIDTILQQGGTSQPKESNDRALVYDYLCSQGRGLESVFADMCMIKLAVISMVNRSKMTTNDTADGNDNNFTSYDPRISTYCESALIYIKHTLAVTCDNIHEIAFNTLNIIVSVIQIMTTVSSLRDEDGLSYIHLFKSEYTARNKVFTNIKTNAVEHNFHFIVLALSLFYKQLHHDMQDETSLADTLLKLTDVNDGTEGFTALQETLKTIMPTVDDTTREKSQ